MGLCASIFCNLSLQALGRLLGRLLGQQLQKSPQKTNYTPKIIDLFHTPQISVLTTERSLCGGLHLDMTPRGHTPRSGYQRYVGNYWS
jgi:hypothetical protein